jgi:uncharacterized coiled-coil DUF342 family protein
MEEAEDVGIVDELNQQIADLRAEIDGLNVQLAEVTYWRDQYSGQNETRQQQIDALREEVAARNADVDLLRTEVAQLTEAVKGSRAIHITVLNEDSTELEFVPAV